MLVNLNEVLIKAKKEGYAVGLFNTTDSDMLQAVIEAAEELHSPVIIGTAEVLLPYGELELIAPSVIHAAKNASVPVVVHYDHGLTFDRCMQALRLGFSSIMFDGSALNFSENIEQTKEIVRIAHSFGATVEGEIGNVGQADSCDNDNIDMYTTVDEATSYINDTGVDALAISIGTAHGIYKSAPRLDIDRLKEIGSATDIPLVLHGGSGLSDEDFKNCIRNGISKVNIFTDLCLAGVEAMKYGIENSMEYLQIRNEKVRFIRENIKAKIRLFGSENKA